MKPVHVNPAPVDLVAAAVATASAEAAVTAVAADVPAAVVVAAVAPLGANLAGKTFDRFRCLQ